MSKPKEEKKIVVNTPLIFWVVAKIDKKQKIKTLQGVSDWIQKQKDKDLYVAVPMAFGNKLKLKPKGRTK